MPSSASTTNASAAAPSWASCPNRAAVLRLFRAPFAEQTDEWLVDRRYFSELSLRHVVHAADNPLVLLEREAQAG
jgi:hypothetical protein